MVMQGFILHYKHFLQDEKIDEPWKLTPLWFQKHLYYVNSWGICVLYYIRLDLAIFKVLSGQITLIYPLAFKYSALSCPGGGECRILLR